VSTAAAAAARDEKMAVGAPKTSYHLSLNATELPNSLSPISFDIVIKWTVLCAGRVLSFEFATATAINLAHMLPK
jgi:hypothetical protein